ncbi:MAG: hypothetical protein NT062_06760, partial [Proteobacteria bacterium]|nr:hypothetical protein [Pseudomonadota bacterium]
TYGYAADDHVQQVTDPEGVTTLLAHDLAGHRTSITRGARTWTYTYDRNGNLQSEEVPRPAGASQLDYVTTTVYDDLDRPVSRVIGKRGLSAADVALFGADHETMVWDYPQNRKNRLVYFQSRGPGNPTPAVNEQLYYDSLGHEMGRALGLSVGGIVTPLTATYYTSTLLGSPRAYRFQDRINSSAEETAQVYYDHRGLPTRLGLTPPGTTERPIGEQTRNVAGLVTKRRTNWSWGTLAFVESNWTYDALGRVTGQDVLKGPGAGTRIARQDLAYFGGDDPKTLDHWLGATNQKHFVYGYDARHQIASVGETLQSSFAATYAYGASGRFAHVDETATALPNSDVVPRHVNYQYAGTDPEQVTALVGTATPTVGTFASYRYDDAGNQTARCSGTFVGSSCTGALTECVYDGKDQLRRATKKSSAGAVLGSEEYWYDGNGLRTSILKRDSAGTRTELVVFNREVEYHYDGAGAVQFAYSHLALGTPVARVARTGPSNTDYTLEFQAHGLADNLLAAVDGSGGVRVGLVHTPFGSTIEATDVGGTTGLAGHPRRMNDKYTDDLSGLAYYGARYYDRSSMTWTQGDPLYRFTPEAAWTSPRRSSLYTMSLNNPLRYVDPDGQDPRLTPQEVYDNWQCTTKGADIPIHSHESTAPRMSERPTLNAEAVVSAYYAVKQAAASVPTGIGSVVFNVLTMSSDQAPSASAEADIASSTAEGTVMSDLPFIPDPGIGNGGRIGTGFGIRGSDQTGKLGNLGDEVSRDQHYSAKGGHRKRSEANAPSHKQHWKEEDKAQNAAAYARAKADREAAAAEARAARDKKRKIE